MELYYYNQTKELKLNEIRVEEEGEIDDAGQNSVSFKMSTLNTKVLGNGEQQKYRTCETKSNLMNNSLIYKAYSSEDQHTTRWSAVKQEYSSEFRVLDKQIETMISCSENVEKGKPVSKVYNCKVCGKVDTKHHLGDHIEANHIDGIAIPCKLCEKYIKSRNALRHHVRTHSN